MTTFTNNNTDALIDNVLTEANVRADVAAAFSNDSDLVLTDVATSNAYAAPASNDDDCLEYCDMLLLTM